MPLFPIALVRSTSSSSRPAATSSRARRDMIEGIGRFFQFIGMPRTTGQIYGLLYLSMTPMSLDDVVEQLSISKASASLGTRHLAGWGAIRPTWVPGDRRDHFECTGDIRTLLRGSYNDLVKPRMNATNERLAVMLKDLEKDAAEGAITHQEHKFCADRLQSLERLQKQIQKLLPLAEKLL